MPTWARGLVILGATLIGFMVGGGIAVQLGCELFLKGSNLCGIGVIVGGPVGAIAGLASGWWFTADRPGR